ncbi:protein TolQ [Stutzerimonas azotifigens]|uniref:protein TolQ n=1 Tax=Stutzerimonas azotifigens TaxID=291995 RepID=UPI0004040C9A|nr:protein TolQ [Stutzerimonas azotifigens]
MHATLEQMTVWGLISEASLLVQGVMLVLLLASLSSWYLIVWRAGVLRRSERELRAFQAQLRSTPDLARLQREHAEAGAPDAGAQQLFQAGYRSFAELRREPGIAAEVVLEGVEHGLAGALAEQEQRLEKGLPFLATVGSVSPYVGLFGTVWGIMNSFLGLSQVQQATLSTVAPGIAEALIATAIGLFAAIPAVIAYNRFAAGTQSLMARYYAFANELQGRLHRNLHSAASLAKAA